MFLRQIQQESGFNPNARSSAGAQGIAQFMPATARGFGINPLDPVQALFAAAKYDRQGVDKYGSLARALSAYNSGRPDAYRDPHFAGGQTFNYVKRILGAGGAASSVPAAAAPPAAGAASFGGGPLPPRPTGGLSPAILSLLNSNNRIIGVPELNLPSNAPANQGVPSALPMPSEAVRRLPVASGVAPKVRGRTLRYIEHFASPFGLTITSTTGGKHARGSYHYKGRAVDFGGDPRKMAALAKYALQHANQFQEMFYTGPGHPDYFISGGKVLPLAQLDRGLYLQHENHTHLAR